MRLAENSLFQIATQCVEAGVDFSFRSAFRENWALAGLVRAASRG